jgi:hypothetical protein
MRSECVIRQSEGVFYAKLRKIAGQKIQMWLWYATGFDARGKIMLCSRIYAPAMDHRNASCHRIRWVGKIHQTPCVCWSLACVLVRRGERSCRAVSCAALSLFVFWSPSASSHQGYLRGAEFHDENGPSLGPPQLPAVLTRLLRVGCRVKLPRTSLRPSTLPNPSTSGRSRSNGSDCRTVRPVGSPGVISLVPGRLGPGSPKYE